MNIDTLHLTAFALESSGAAAMSIGSVHTLTLKAGHPTPGGWPFAGSAGIGLARAGQPAEAVAMRGLTLTFPLEPKA
ncbi:MAG: hypothetical protein EON92_12250 [Burkholderiales bacterium]|nr:MAG: hypothetical protein EON92_12250 [Burkholderiales bacterium]